MTKKFKQIVTNFSFVISSNLISIIISSVAVLILPRFLDVTEYGYWQLYMFYISYVGFFHLGWPDGIYLKFGGKKYEELNKSYFLSQFLSQNIFQIILGLLIACYALFFKMNSDRIYILIAFSINLFTVNSKNFIVLLLQTTNRLKQSSLIVISDRILYLILILSVLIFGVYDYKNIIVMDVFSKCLSSVYAVWVCRDLFKASIQPVKVILREAFDNIKIGINLMLSNIASMLIIGSVRLGIENQWSIEVFAKVSLTISISNLMLIFINAVGIVIFPVLKRTKDEYLPRIYHILRTVLMIVMFGILVAYFPIKLVLYNWLPAYRESLVFMSLIFPLCVYEGKMSLLINTYLKALRMEKVILKVNLFAMILSISLTIITTYVLKNIDLAVLSILFLLISRCVIAEMYLSKKINISVGNEILLEIVMTCIFVFSAWKLSTKLSVIIYVMSYLVYIFIKKRDIADVKKEIKILLKN